MVISTKCLQHVIAIVLTRSICNFLESVCAIVFILCSLAPSTGAA